MKKFLLCLVGSVAVLSLHISAIAKEPPQGGTYKFTDKNGKEYIGKTNDFERREKEHIRSGKLPKENVGTFKPSPSSVSPEGRAIIERTRIKSADIATNGNLGNKQNAPYSRAASKKK